LKALEHFVRHTDARGVYNVCGPKPVTNRELMQALGRALHRPAILPLPAFAVRTIFGEMGQEILLGGQKVLPKRLLADGFVFQDTDLDGFLKKELGR
jgi:NAD dependent epimerase/dehydratase family enzyme